MWLNQFFFLLYFLVFIACSSKQQNPLLSDDNLQTLNELIQRHPFEDTLYYYRAQHFYEHDQLALAIKDMEYAIKLDSSIPRYDHLLADLYMDDHKSYEGLQTMMLAAHKYPDRIPTLLKLAEFQNILKQQDASIQTLLKILTINPAEAEAYLMIGINYRDLQDTINAIMSFEKATTLNDQLTDGWLLLGQMVNSTDPDKSKMYFENALRIDTMNVQTRHALASFYQDTDPIKAIDQYTQIINLEPTYTDAYLNAGILYFSLDSFKKALELFTVLQKLEPSQSINYYYSGTAREALGDQAGAKSDYQTALNLNPGNKSIEKALKQLQ